MDHHNTLWLIFAILVPVALIVDLGFFQRRAHEVKVKEALMLSAFWIFLALAFNALVYYWQGEKTALEFLTGYIIEESLSVDNLFVFLVIFSYFGVKPVYQHKVLFWGIIGVIVMRGIFIFAGVALINSFHWIIYVFGAFLIFTAIRMVMKKDEEIHPEQNPILKIFRKLMPVTSDYEGSKFFVKRDGKLWATPLFIVVLVVETTDVVFAVDSIPAVLGITTDPFVVYTSNIFAVLGLRAMFFALAGVMRVFHHLHYGLSLILAFVGVKMLIAGYYKIPIAWALGVVAFILAASMLASVLFPKKEEILK